MNKLIFYFTLLTILAFNLIYSDVAKIKINNSDDISEIEDSNTNYPKILTKESDKSIKWTYMASGGGGGTISFGTNSTDAYRGDWGANLSNRIVVLESSMNNPEIAGNMNLSSNSWIYLGNTNSDVCIRIGIIRTDIKTSYVHQLYLGDNNWTNLIEYNIYK